MVDGGGQGASGCGVLVSCDRADGYLKGPFWRYHWWQYSLSRG